MGKKQQNFDKMIFEIFSKFSPRKLFGNEYLENHLFYQFHTSILSFFNDEKI